MKRTLLVLDDDALILEAIAIALQGTYDVVSARSQAQAVSQLSKHEVDAALIDLHLGHAAGEGIGFLQTFKARYPDKPALIISGERDVAAIVECMKQGAEDYLEKPFDRDTLIMRLERVFHQAAQASVYHRAYEKTKAEHQIVGADPQLARAKEQVVQAGPLRILFLGETGVGKTPFARLASEVLSEQTQRLRPFEQVNCACLSVESFHDTLFGHKKGAYTGAVSDKRGLVEIAKGGDLFLDEVGEMPLAAQAMLLTFLDTHEFYRLGDDVKRRADVRILAATNRDLKKCVREGTFRQDLYSRLSQVVVRIPALRERLGDLRELFEYFVLRFSGFAKPYDPQILTVFRQRAWDQGNVRELQDAIEVLCLRSRGGPRLELGHLDPVEEAQPARSIMPASVRQGLDELLAQGLEGCVDAYESSLLSQCLQEYPGTLDQLALDLKVSRPTLYRRIKRHGLKLTELRAKTDGNALLNE